MKIFLYKCKNGTLWLTIKREVIKLNKDQLKLKLILLSNLVAFMCTCKQLLHSVYSLNKTGSTHLLSYYLVLKVLFNFCKYFVDFQYNGKEVGGCKFLIFIIIIIITIAIITITIVFIIINIIIMIMITIIIIIPFPF